MKKNGNHGTVFSARLRQARLLAGLTQIELGVLAGIDEFSASARVNQYERGVHAPDHGTAARLAAALKVPVSYLFEPNDMLAKVIFTAGKLDENGLEKVLDYINSLA